MIGSDKRNPMKRNIFLIVGLLLTASVAKAANEKPAHKNGSRQPVQISVCNDVPAHPFDLILGRPTSNSVTISVLFYQDAEGRIEYGTRSGNLDAASPSQKFKACEPAEICLNSLPPDAQIFYRLHTAQTSSPEFSFHTARPQGGAFKFTITADSHLDEHSDCEFYQRTLANALADKADFNIDLGDTFMTEKHASRTNAAKQYLSQRFYFGTLCKSAPLFLVLGNHDGESPRGRGDESDSLAIWANATRKKYYPNPVPDNFYSGDATKHPQAGLLQDYFAWTWGDALFVTLDPFWFSQPQRGRKDNWNRTLGTEQYLWLMHTLEKSQAGYKFIFIHHLVGGGDDQCRGGIEAAPYFEWGGHNRDGSDGFKENRPGWPLPVHQLLVKNNVTAVFHGHDHLFAKQELDGIVYQECPQPSDPNGSLRNAAAYGYTNGVILASSGHLRVAVSASEAKVDCVRNDGSIAHTYVITPRVAHFQ